MGNGYLKYVSDIRVYQLRNRALNLPRDQVTGIRARDRSGRVGASAPRAGQGHLPLTPVSRYDNTEAPH